MPPESCIFYFTLNGAHLFKSKFIIIIIIIIIINNINNNSNIFNWTTLTSAHTLSAALFRYVCNCVGVFLCVCVCVCASVCEHVWVVTAQVWILLWVRGCVLDETDVCTVCVSVCRRLCVSVCAHTCVCMCVCLWVSTFMCVCVWECGWALSRRRDRYLSVQHIVTDSQAYVYSRKTSRLHGDACDWQLPRRASVCLFHSFLGSSLEI